MTEPRESSEMVYIARCPEHGLHGERDECFVCGREVDQVEMVPTTWRGLEAILDAYYPTGVFDGSSGDPGSRIVVLARELGKLRWAAQAVVEAQAATAVDGHGPYIRAKGERDMAIQRLRGVLAEHGQKQGDSDA